MASFVRRTMVYLGLVDDDYDDYEPYDEPMAARPARGYGDEAMAATPSSIRTIPREISHEQQPGVTLQPRAVVRPITPVKAPTVHVVAPRSFEDAQEIGDRFKAGQPVIVNLQNVQRDLARRMIDFCSGVTYALAGSMSAAAEHVFLLTPSNVEVSAEEKRKLEARGLMRDRG